MTKGEQSQLYETYYPKVYGYIQSKINHHHEVEDISSEVFLKIFSNLDSFHASKSSLSTWIYTITKNTVTDYFRTNRQTIELEDDIQSAQNVVDEVCKKESLDELAKALEALSDLERDVILLYFYQEKSIKEIAKKTGYSLSYIKAVKNNALKRLKIMMDE